MPFFTRCLELYKSLKRKQKFGYNGKKEEK